MPVIVDSVVSVVIFSPSTLDSYEPQRLLYSPHSPFSRDNDRVMSSLTDLLLLGRGSDLSSERGVSCTGELPAASDPDLVARATQARKALGSRAMVLGHHYQRDEVIQFADITGDSFKLAQAAADNSDAEYIFFCGVHFMAESADILTSEQQKVILPDLAAGCSMADMATANQVSDAWKVFEKLGIDSEITGAKVILWRGHCSVHGRFSLDNINEVRQKVPGVKVLVHPECQHDVVKNSDVVGSTEMIIRTVAESPAGSQWAVGTELNLVKRLAANNPDKSVIFLDKTVCYCSTMNRIDLPHLVWAMESLVEGRLVNQIKVEPTTAHFARVALERMLALP